MSFFSPFFFLLVDSSLVSTGVGFTGVAVLSAVCAAGVAPAAVLSPVAAEALELDELELETAAGGLLSAGGLAVPEPFRAASIDSSTIRCGATSVTREAKRQGRTFTTPANL